MVVSSVLAGWHRAVRAALRRSRASRWVSVLGGAVGASAAPGAADALELPADRAEVMVHSYDGGGYRVQGPALLVRKSVADRVSLLGMQQVDVISSASIDVLTTASPYRERRREETIGIDLLAREVLVTASFSRSREPDFTADTAHVDVAHELFGGVTTLRFGYSRGYDTIGQRFFDAPFERANRWRFRVGGTQMLTPRLAINLQAEALSDEGYLASPYRAARVLGALVPERVPDARSGRAFRAGVVADLGSRTALRADFRYYYDTWDIDSRTLEVGGRLDVSRELLLDVYARVYRQSSAVFYSDNAGADNQFVSRNRQYASFRSTGPGARLSYALPSATLPFVGRLELNAHANYERIRYTYDDFTDLRTGVPYSHDASVIQLSVSANF